MAPKAEAQRLEALRPNLTAAFGFGALADPRPKPDTLNELRSGFEAHLTLGMSVESPDHLLSAQVEASYHRFLGIIFFCFDVCAKNALPRGAWSVRLGTRWQIPSISRCCYLSAGAGFYSPFGAMAHWNRNTAGLDLGVGRHSPYRRVFLDTRVTKLVRPGSAWIIQETIGFYL